MVKAGILSLKGDVCIFFSLKYIPRGYFNKERCSLSHISFNENNENTQVSCDSRH